MIRQDCIVVIETDPLTDLEQWFFLPTNSQAREAIGMASKAFPISIGNITGYVITDNAEKARAVMKKVSALDIHITDMPLMAAIFNAEQQALDYAQKDLIKRASDYFTPLFESALKERDADKAAEIVNQFPYAVERSFMVDACRQAGLIPKPSIKEG